MEGRVLSRRGLWWDRWTDWWYLGRCRMTLLLMVPTSSSASASWVVASLMNEPMVTMHLHHHLHFVVCLWVSSAAWASPCLLSFRKQGGVCWVGVGAMAKSCHPRGWPCYCRGYRKRGRGAGDKQQITLFFGLPNACTTGRQDTTPDVKK